MTYARDLELIMDRLEEDYAEAMAEIRRLEQDNLDLIAENDRLQRELGGGR